jgi:hypothetical protein
MFECFFCNKRATPLLGGIWFIAGTKIVKVCSWLFFYVTQLCYGIMLLQKWTFVLFKIFLSLWVENASVLCYSKNGCIYTFHVKLSILLRLRFLDIL